MSNPWAYHRDRARVRAMLAREGPEREATPRDVCEALVALWDDGWTDPRLGQVVEAARAALSRRE